MKIVEMVGRVLDERFSHTWTALGYEELVKFSFALAEKIEHEYTEKLHAQDICHRHVVAELYEENARLVNAIEKTLEENGHLADGDNCTLILLKRALKNVN